MRLKSISINIWILNKFFFKLKIYSLEGYTVQSSFFAHFMCFEVPALVPPGGVANGGKSGYNDDDANDDDLGIMDIDDNDSKVGMLS